jgi:hypothetical protein
VNQNAFFVVTQSGLATQVVSGPLRSVADGANGVYGSAAGTFPASSFSSSNYFVDLIVDTPTVPTAPTVTATSPTSGATGIAPNTQVTATLSRAMDAATLTTSTFTLTGPGGAVAGTVAYDSNTNVVTLTPSANLAFNTVYTARLDSSVRASDGTALGSAFSWSFTTAVAVPPQVTSTVPANGATGIAPGVVVKATFSRALNAATVTASSFTLTGPSGTVTATVSYDASLQQASLTPSAALAPGTYTARLAASIAATDGATLGTQFTWTFTVPSAPVALTVAPGTPAAGASGVDRASGITAVFNRDVTAGTVSTSSFQVSIGAGAAVPATVTYDAASRTATLVPTAPLAASTTYTVKLTNAIHSDDGTVLSGTTSWTFTTGTCSCTVFPASLAPTITGAPTQDGRTGAGPFSYELGMKFTVDAASQLTGIRFYKSTGETGSHTGRLWTADGTLVTTVTFSGESASGWQQATFATPVALQTGTTYVVSVNANAFFVVTPAGLATSQGSGPLHSVVGANGVYGLSAGAFPTNSYNNGNYFVDVVVR